MAQSNVLGTNRSFGCGHMGENGSKYLTDFKIPTLTKILNLLDKNKKNIL